MEIKVLGTGCPKCKKLTQLTEETIKENGIEANVTKVEDINDIMGYGILSTPALVVNDKIVLSGKIPKKDDLIKLLT